MIKKVLKHSIVIEIIKQDDKWSEFDDSITESFCLRIIRASLSEFPETNLMNDIEVSLTLANDIEVQAYNNKYRQKNKPTNVLSFPITPDLLSQKNFPPYTHLGDIVFALETIEKEAADMNKSFIDHFTHLLVHSTLHLLGVNHKSDSEYEYMKKKEIAILAKLGLDSPYE